jgi:arginyl-tRNA synthetase
LNVEFDVYSGESQMSEGMKEAVKLMEEKKLLTTDEKGGEIVDLSKFKLGTAVIKKKDGATLYITRDLAAAKARSEEYKFDKSIYVVAAQQDLHFKQLFKMLEMMGYEWSTKCVHVNFGMVNGMKTRKGQVVFLEEILNEAKAVMLEKMQENKMGKLEEVENPEQTADIVGLSAVVVQDLSAKRIKDYDVCLPFDCFACESLRRSSRDLPTHDPCLTYPEKDSLLFLLFPGLLPDLFLTRFFSAI